MLLIFYLSFATLTLVAEVKGQGQYLGSSLSYTVGEENGTYVAYIDMIAGWVLGKGPCGSNCNRSAIGRSTSTSHYHSTSIFGQWSMEYRYNHIVHTISLANEVNRTFTEDILDVNEVSQWEQERMQFSVKLTPHNVSSNAYDIMFKGTSWRKLDMLPSNVDWYSQVKLHTDKRSDTGMPNKSPVVFTKPYYRVPLNKVTTIPISAIDPDGDVVKCSTARFVEAGSFSQHPSPGIQISQDCVVSFNASSALGYHDTATAAVVLTIRDYVTKPIMVSDTFTPPQFFISSTPVQFFVQMFEHMETPEFDTRTAHSRTWFPLYTGSKWALNIYAKTSGQTKIDRFDVVGRKGERIAASAVQVHPAAAFLPQYRNVRFAELTWTPTSSDIGEHIICISAVDDTGVYSAEERCYYLEVYPGSTASPHTTQAIGIAVG